MSFVNNYLKQNKEDRKKNIKFRWENEEETALRT